MTWEHFSARGNMEENFTLTSKNLKPRKRIVYQLQTTFQYLSKRYIQTVRLRRELKTKFRRWHDTRNALLFPSYRTNEESINALRDAISTNWEDLGLLRCSSAHKLRKLSEREFSVRMSDGEWWTIAQYLIRSLNLMSLCFIVFDEACRELKLIEMVISTELLYNNPDS